jgi:hypothetical protein
MSPMSTAAMNAVEPQKAGVASGILSMSRMVGGTFGVAALGALFHEPGHDAFIHALSRGMWLSAGVAALGVVFAITLIGGKAVRHPAVPEAAGVPAAEGSSPATEPEAAAAAAEMAEAA